MAFRDVQESVAELPLTIDVGLIDKVQLGRGAVTVIVLVQVFVPPAPVTVAVYVVVAAGDTEREPLATGVTLPMPWLIEIAVAFSDVQESEEELP